MCQKDLKIHDRSIKAWNGWLLLGRNLRTMAVNSFSPLMRNSILNNSSSNMDRRNNEGREEENLFRIWNFLFWGKYEKNWEFSRCLRHLFRFSKVKCILFILINLLGFPSSWMYIKIKFTTILPKKKEVKKERNDIKFPNENYHQTLNVYQKIPFSKCMGKKRELSFYTFSIIFSGYPHWSYSSSYIILFKWDSLSSLCCQQRRLRRSLLKRNEKKSFRRKKSK